MRHETIQTDLLVIGTGLAGLSLALHVADRAQVICLAKREPAASNTHYAQGGIAAAVAPSDSVEQHVADTLRAGAGLCRTEAVESILSEAPAAIDELMAWGVQFERTESGFHLAREGGHGERRILHVADRTGQAILATLLARAEAHPNITILPEHIAIDLITDRTLHNANQPAPPGAVRPNCYGAYTLDHVTGQVKTIGARATCLATGGAGKVYLYTSNPDVASGDGLAMAHRAGAALEHLEFVQFHPTCLYHPAAKSFLISEAVRGEGGLLRLVTGERFMHHYDARGELATRDVVARAIDAELKRHGHDHVELDISHRPAELIRERFPEIYHTCLHYGIDMTKQSIPVVPAAHYFCGGVVTDLQARTDVTNLLACGEVASTGLHGANRLASNSLMESAVMARRAAATALDFIARNEPMPELPPWDDVGTSDSDESVVIAHNWDEVRRTMWNYVGIVRSNKRLARAAARIALLRQEINEYYWNFTVTSDLIELRNIALVAELIIEAARARRENCGLHFNIDNLLPA